MKRLLLTAGLCATCGFAQAENFAAAVKAGTLGLGIEGTGKITDHFNGRIGFNTFTHDTTGTEHGNEYKSELKLRTFAGMVDWFPSAGGSFRATAGFYANGNGIALTGNATGSYEFNGTTYTGAEVGNLKVDVDFASTAGYLGIGWGNAVRADRAWGFTMDLGVLFQGSPKLKAQADGLLAGNPQFQADLEAERQHLEDEFSDFDIYPVVEFGVSYRF